MPISRSQLQSALLLFNQAQFFEAHEALEDLWRARAASDPAKRHLQGFVQLAVALHHESCGNWRGAKSVFERALHNLAGAENSFPDLDLEPVRRDLANWQRYLTERNQKPAPLRIAYRTSTR